MIDATFFRFVLVGIVNTLVGYAIIMLLFHVMGLGYALSYFLSYMVGIIISFFLNRHFVFFSQKSKAKEFLKFLIAFVLSYGVSYMGLYFIMENHLLSANIAFFAGMVIYSILFYLLNRYITFV